jgi:hypothetical protein
MDLSRFTGAYRLGAARRPAYDPAMMVAVLLYAFARGNRSSRGIERACWEDVAYKVITSMRTPDHSTIAEFRRRHETEIAELFDDVLGLCREAGLVSVGDPSAARPGPPSPDPVGSSSRLSWCPVCSSFTDVGSRPQNASRTFFSGPVQPRPHRPDQNVQRRYQPTVRDPSVLAGGPAISKRPVSSKRKCRRWNSAQPLWARTRGPWFSSNPVVWVRCFRDALFGR